MARPATAATRPGPRPGTSREAIVKSAIKLLDREGAHALTFRGVARELGVTVGALSRYFSNLADLRDAVAAEIVGKVRPLDARGKRALREQLVRLGLDWLAVTRSHPYLLAAQGPLSAVPIARHVVKSLSTLVAAGLDVERALTVYSVVINLAYAWGLQPARPEDAASHAATMRALTEEAPELMGKFASLGAAMGQQLHRRVLERVVDGLL